MGNGTVRVSSSAPYVVLLQGPVGPCFNHLGRFLEAKGYRVDRFAFHAGDRFFSSQNRRRFEGSLAAWERYFHHFLEQNTPDCIIYFGSERPVHRVARSLAKQHDVPVLSLEEGYIRPGFVTVERGGNNANSPLAGCLPDENFNRESVDRQLQVAVNYRSFNRMGYYAILYYVIRTFFSSGQAKELYHRRFFPPAEVFCWLRNGYRKVFHGGADNPVIHRLLEHHPGQYFLVPLQVAADSNLQKAALGWDSLSLITSTIISFARSAPKQCRLVFKVHPLERGHNRYEEEIKEIATQQGIADRVELIDTGSMGMLTRHAAGMITINSTSGLSAIHHGIPLLVVGRALYEHPELAVCGAGKPDFDQFWHAHEQDDVVAPVEFRHRYLDWIRYRALIPGDFYQKEGIDRVCEGIYQKLVQMLNA